MKKYDDEKFNYDWSEPGKDKVAVIYAVGNIHSGNGMPGRSIGSITTAASIRKAREDETVLDGAASSEEKSAVEELFELKYIGVKADGWEVNPDLWNMYNFQQRKKHKKLSKSDLG